MKGLLINPKIRVTSPPAHIPYGLAILLRIADELGENVALFDNNILRLPLEALKVELRLQEWDWVGVGGFSSQYRYIKPIVKLVKKECPGSVILAGGGFMTSQPKDIMKWLPEITVGIIGEAEETFPEVLDHIGTERWTDIRGIIYREADELILTKPRPQIKDLDEIPYPAWDLLQLNPIVEKGMRYNGYFQYSALPLSPQSLTAQRRLDVISERGCPRNCTFCTHLGMSYRDLVRIYGEPAFKDCPTRYNVRYNTAEYVVEMIKEMRFKYAIDFVSILDENFTSNRPRALEFCNLFEESGLSTLVKWGCLGDVTTVDYQLLQRMKDTGCCYISYGGESASQPMLDSIKKKQTPIQMQEAVNVTMKTKIVPIMTFMMGYPNENVNDMLETVLFWRDNLVECSPFYVTPYPNTELYYEYKDTILEQFDGDLEKFIEALGDATDFVVNLSQWSDPELIGLREMMAKKDVRRIIRWAQGRGIEVDEKFLRELEN